VDVALQVSPSGIATGYRPGGQQALGNYGGDPDFLAFLNSWMRYQQDTGWLAERRKYWLNSFAWEDQL
jgi:ABC-type amino acid transport substrate-binding protein